MPHFLVIFTSRKITKATIMKVIKATRKSPIRNFWLATGTSMVAKLSIPGKARPITGIIKSLTSA